MQGRIAPHPSSQWFLKQPSIHVSSSEKLWQNSTYSLTIHVTYVRCDYLILDNAFKLTVFNNIIKFSCTVYSYVSMPPFLYVCYIGLFEMIVGVLTTCHTQYTWDRCTCILLFNRTTLQIFVTYLTGALYVHPETEGTNQNRYWNHHRWYATNSLERTRLSCWCLYNHKGCTYRAPIRYATKTWSVVLLNKKHTYIPISSVLCMTSC